MPIIPVDDPDDPRLADYRDIPDPALLRERGVFIAESRLVVRELLTHPHLATRSLFVTEAALSSLRDLVAGRAGDATADDLPIYVGANSLLGDVVGYSVHRGCLAAGVRPGRATDADLEQLETARLVVILESVANPDNVGGIFRNAVAFGADCVLLSPSCCDPLYRKAIRTSLGATLRVAYGHVDDWPDGLRRLRALGVTVAALTPDPDAPDIDAFVASRPTRVAVLLGSEGPGLSEGARAMADCRVRIPIEPEIDSLNVATASGIALHRLSSELSHRARRPRGERVECDA